MKNIIGYFGCILATVLLINCCNHKVNAIGNGDKSGDTLVAENFDAFIRKFYSDSLFQVSRIVFPLTSETKTARLKKLIEEKDPNAEIDEAGFVPHSRKNWTILNDASFRNDSVADVGGIRYIRRFFKTYSFVEENILYADPEQVMIISKFKLINRKWYLIDFQDGFADE